MKELAAVGVYLKSDVRRLLQLLLGVIVGLHQVGCGTVQRLSVIFQVFYPVFKWRSRVEVKLSGASGRGVDWFVFTAPHVARLCLIVFSPENDRITLHWEWHSLSLQVAVSDVEVKIGIVEWEIVLGVSVLWLEWQLALGVDIVFV
jgi:hypothetical protein